MTIAPGTRLGAYEILSALGAGGMGEVYRARDRRLDRDVAIKLLPEHFANDADRLVRFEREAKTLAALNHPNIAAIYGVEEDAGVRALVMELVEGSTLADRLVRGRLALIEALTVARQIAEALEAAHEKGIIHRDLKPGNVMVTPEGMTKVLDFGLAAVAQEPGSAQPDATHSPTLTLAAANAGVILGTAAYMSPEQAVGKPVDKRSDIWSFGVLLWETLTGARLFQGETVAHTLADVLRAPIDFDTLPRGTPSTIRDLLRRCLDRDPRRRLRDIGEARVAIEACLAGREPSAAAVPTAATSWRRLTVAWGVAAVAIAAAAALGLARFRAAPVVIEPVRFQILPPQGVPFSTTGVFSPDGRHLAFAARGSDGRLLLWVRSLDSIEARPLSGTEGITTFVAPFWSPDSLFLAFGVNGFPGRLKKVAVTGSPPQTLSEYSGNFRGGAWSAEGAVLYSSGGGIAGSFTGLMRVSDAGGTPAAVTQVDAGRRELHVAPAFLPDGRRFLYYRGSAVAENTGVFLGSLDASPEAQNLTRLLAADSAPLYVPAMDSDRGDLLFLREGTLLTQTFDPRTETLIGDAVPVAEGIGSNGTGGYGWFSASQTGHLAYRRGGAAAVTELIWFDREGKRLGQLGPSADYTHFNLAPDGRRVVAVRAAGVRAWEAEVSRGIFSRLIAGEGTEGSMVVAPNSGRIAFSSTMNGAVGDLYWTPAGGVGLSAPLLVKSSTVKHPNHFSPDGRFLIFDDHSPQQRQDLWILPVDDASAGRLPDRKPIPFLVTPADETFGQFSPDGKWIAYSSDESGQVEVYVQGFAPDRVPAAAVGKWQISTAGGDKPRWSRNGRELYYIASDGMLMAVPVKTGDAFEPGVGVPLFETMVVGFFPYDVTADGRFLLLTPAETGQATFAPVTVVLNWQANLRKQ